MENEKPKSSNGCLTAALISLGIGALVFLTLPKALVTPTHVRSLTTGSGIYRSVFANIFDVATVYTSDTVKLPRSIQNSQPSELEFENSTEYLAYLVKEDIIAVNWSYFAGPEIPSAPGKYDEEDPDSTENFKAENNMWNVVADLDIEDSGAPFLISRNLDASQLQSSGKPTLKGPPYGKKQIVVIRIGGSGEVLRGKDITWENINPGGLKNVILRP